jgi:hypothetical protein
MSAYGYRRGSIFWALTLIAVGGLFLYQNFNPLVHPWQILAKFWPILIIFWGLSKLIDYIQAQAHPETAPPSMFSGSEVILLLLILVLGTVVSRLVLRPWHEWPRAMGVNVDDDDFAGLFLNSFTYTKTVSMAVKGQPHLVLSSRRGDVEVSGANRSDVEAVVKETIRAENDAEAKKLSDQLKYEIVEQAGHYQFQSNLDSLPNSGRAVRLDLTLNVPTVTSTEITAERGEISLEGLHGDQTLTANHGDLRVSQVEGLIRAHKSGGMTEVRDVKGNVELDGRGQDVEISGVTGTVTVNGEYPGTVQFRNVAQALRFTSSRTDLTVQKLKGQLNMEMGSLEASDVEGPFEIATREKDITLTGFNHSVKIADTNGSINLRTAVAPTHPIEVDSKKGEIELTLPPDSSFVIEATSRHGEVESDFSAPTLKITKEGETPSITGSYGKGGPTIRLTTQYGTVRVAREGGVVPAPKTPKAAPAESPSQESEESLAVPAAEAPRAWRTYPVTRANASKKPGKETSAQSLPRMRVVPWATNPPTANAMAIR